jgi:hypothetical protein
MRWSRIFSMPSRCKGVGSGIALLLSWLAFASAHTGPPEPVLVDQLIGPYPVSIWADLEVGTGRFFIRLESPADGKRSSDITVHVGVQPASGRLAEARYQAQRQVRGRQVQYQAEVPVDAQELWRVRIIVQGADGSGEATLDMMAVPPGLGRWDVLVYLFPFLAVGCLSLQVVLYRRKRRQAIRGRQGIGTSQEHLARTYHPNSSSR